MTPEQIHELLDNATPGPWEARATYDDGTPRPDTTREMRAGDQYLGIMHAPDADLAAAAPDLAELVAGMHYEYAVQHDRYGEWLYETTRHATTKDPTLAMWWDDVEDARDEARTCYNGCNTRIVRRLVGESEVVA